MSADLTPKRTRSRRSRRGVRRRAMALLLILLLGPAVAFSWLGWRSLRREHGVRATELAHEAERVLTRRVDLLMDRLARIEAREAKRPYYAYQDTHLAPGVDQGFLFQASPLEPSAEEPLVRGWFQWEVVGNPSHPVVPDVFPVEDVELGQALRAGYAADLVLRLERAAAEVGEQGGGTRTRVYPLRVVAANEERGQLSEELSHLEPSAPLQDMVAQHAALPGAASNPVASVPYFDSFEERTRGERTVSVRIGVFRYLARAAGAEGPELVAYRLVSIPPQHASLREVRQPRWLLQGYALHIGAYLPDPWLEDGSTQLATGQNVSPGARLARRSLASALDADTAVLSGGEQTGERSPLPERNPRLVLVARANPQALEKAWSKRRVRFLLLLGGLAGLVLTGCFVLYRTLRSELDLVGRKEDFMAAITHELKTPLTGIRMYAEMLREGWTDNAASAERYATRIMEESQRLGQLVEQVLDLTALERGVAEAQATPGDLGDTVRKAVALMASKAKAQGVALDCDVESDLPNVSFDPRLVRPLVLNLVDNAIKYGSKAEMPRVRVRVQRAGERVVVRIEDNGPGIDPSVRKHLFEPFWRAKGELTRDTPGVGIGLALVKRYAQAHRARVSVESEPGRGTTVKVRFPIARPA